MKTFKLGLIINPLAGIGGAVGLKGSDGDTIVTEALSRGATKQAPVRAAQVLDALRQHLAEIEIIAAPGEMGSKLCEAMGFSVTTIGEIEQPTHTSATDTEQCARAIAAYGVDVLVFVGGDGTARNIVNSVPAHQLCLGIPAGVKIHSGVYAINVRGASEVLQQLIQGDLVSVDEREVRDIDESAFREGVVRARYYGELRTPQDHKNIQRVKCGGREIEALVLQDIADYLTEQMDEETLYIIGPGTTTRALMESLDLPNTLLGVDLIQNQHLLKSDVSEKEIIAHIQENRAKIVVTPIGGQGHIFGRGNHQISPAVIRHAGQENILVISPASKLRELEGRPLLVDTIDAALNESMAGLIEVITGYEEHVAYALGD